ncbi:MAG TPA: hypothetical protein PKE26_09765 [Kiritimatiellia bacterium]|nr:hypothetical protein [Kiritimatiellia bacterium]HMO99383.1 hypothetical protein [Kiritimatiellia bacterium]HMP96505.1 hypothetical protein [Kiritimatiellia bacterium]
MKKWMAVWLIAVCALGAAQRSDAQQRVGRVGDGTWKSEWEYGGNVVGWSPRNIWVDIWVHNLGFHKEVGIIWTDNNWYTATWSKGAYEFSFAEGSEQWGVDLMPVGKFQWHRSSAHGWVELNGYVQTIHSNGKVIEYVIYYKDISNGRMFWDNNGGANYRIWVVQPGVNGYTL